MFLEYFFFPLVFLENSELLQSLAGLAGLAKLAFALTVLSMLVENLKEVFGKEA